MEDTKLLNKYLKTLKRQGFKVYVPKGDKPPTYANFVKDDKIGYVQCHYFGGLSFSSVHKPNQQTGTGFRANSGGEDEALENSTSADALNACNMFAPNWATQENWASVVKYKDYDDYLSLAVNRIIKKVQL